MWVLNPRPCPVNGKWGLRAMRSHPGPSDIHSGRELGLVAAHLLVEFVVSINRSVFYFTSVHTKVILDTHTHQTKNKTKKRETKYIYIYYLLYCIDRCIYLNLFKSTHSAARLKTLKPAANGRYLTQWRRRFLPQSRHAQTH